MPAAHNAVYKKERDGHFSLYHRARMLDGVGYRLVRLFDPCGRGSARCP